MAGGHRQTYGVNYNETFAMAAKMPYICMVLGNAAQQDWEIHQVDVKSAYLNALSSWVCKSIAQTSQNNQAMSRQPDTSVLFIGANILGKSNNFQNISLLQGFCFERWVLAQQSGMGK